MRSLVATLLVLVWAAFLVFLLWTVRQLEFNNDRWLAEDHPVERSLDWLAEDFDAGETLLVILPLKERWFTSPETQKHVEDLEDQLSALPLVLESSSPLTARTVIQLPPSASQPVPVLEIGSFSYAIKQQAISPDAQQASGKKSYEQAFRDSPYMGYLLSADTLLAAIKLKLDTRENHQGRQVVMREIQQTIQGNWGDDYWLVGSAAIKNELNLRLGDDTVRLLLLAVITAFALLYLLLGSWRQALLISVCASSCMLVALSWLVWLGIPFSAPALILPVMIITVSVADSVHLTLHWNRLYRQHPSAQAAWTALKNLWLPCFSASLTTAIGCGSFILSDIVILSEFSVVAILGVFTAYPLMIAPLIGALALKPDWFDAKVSGRLGIERLYILLVQPIEKRLRQGQTAQILVASMGVLVVSLVLAAGLYRLHTESNFLAIFFDESDHIRQGFDLVDRDLGGSGSVEAILSSDQDSYFSSYSAMESVASVEAALEIPNVLRTDSYLIPIRQVHPHLSGQQGLPENDAELAQEIAFLEYSRSEEQRGVLEPYSDFSYSASRLSMHTPNLGSSDLAVLLDEVQDTVDQQGNWTVTLTGFGVYLHSLAELILETQLLSLMLTFALIFLVFLAQFRGWQSVLGVVANMLPLAATAGLISWLGLPYDFGTILVIGVTLGFAVDDTLHLLHHYAHLKKQDLPADQCLAQALQLSGPGILTAGIVLACSLALLLSSSLVLIDRFAVFSIFGLVVSLICALVLLPGMLLALDKRRSAGHSIH
ncbi:MAG: efflux RND transporter permease subunit [Gammaproteobacteria bacterium]